MTAYKITLVSPTGTESELFMSAENRRELRRLALEIYEGWKILTIEPTDRKPPTSSPLTGALPVPDPPRRRPAMSKIQIETLDRQTDIAIANGTAVEVWFFNGKACFVAYRH